jgi:hypothetical protein
MDVMLIVDMQVGLIVLHTGASWFETREDALLTMRKPHRKRH